MIIDTRGVDMTPPAEWIKKEGDYTFKITDIRSDGYTQEGDEKIKMIFVSHTKEQHSEVFPISAKGLWKLKTLEKVINAPEVYDINDFIGHYFIGIIKGRIHNDKTYYDIKEFRPSPLNEKIPAVPDRSAETTQPEPSGSKEADDLF